ncbi:DUF5704 domain-containing protein [Paenibacillus sp. FSL K6-2524]|uniref:DUF5704 domain-containing protein n=1 Tax=Paenibacillus sp. FSL K6-2524 TaxID=2954516 RepID=UPI0030F9FD33
MVRLSKLLILLFSILLWIQSPHITKANELIMNPDRSIKFETIVKASGGGYRYRTVGFYIHKEPSLTLKPNELTKKGKIMIGDYDTECDDDRTGTQIKFTCTFKASDVENALDQALLGENVSGDKIYASAIFKISNASGNFLDSNTKYFYNYSQILSALPNGIRWPDQVQQDLKEYYNQYLPIIGSEAYTVAIEKGRKFNGNLSSGILQGPTKLIPNETQKVPMTDLFKIGKPFNATFQGNLTINGTQYEIVSSYVTSKNKNWRKEAIINWPNPITTNRNPTVDVMDTYVVAEYKKKLDVDIPDPSGECTDPTPRGRVNGQDMLPSSTGSILEDTPHNPRDFDAVQGIPSSEYLVASTETKNYLFENTFVEMVGECNYKVPVTQEYTLKWDDGGGTGSDGTPLPPNPQTEDGSFTAEMEVKREYSYWMIEKLGVYGIDHAEMSNYALPGGTVTLFPQNYSSPSVDAMNTWKYTPPELKEAEKPIKKVVDGGRSKPSPPTAANVNLQSYAEKAVGKVKVNNDSLTFNGSVIMDGSEKEEKGATPSTIPPPTLIQVLREDNLQIEYYKANHVGESNGTIYYSQLVYDFDGDEDQEYPIERINRVTVHTPVVNYAKVLDDDNRPFDQRMVTNRSIPVVILDREFTVKLDEYGEHSDKPGYKHPFTKYTEAKRVRFPFGVFDGAQYIEENTWIYIDVGTAEKKFKMPTWIDEDKYTIETEVIAINAEMTEINKGNGCQTEKNSDLANHCAKRTMDVDVVGRLFGFRIWDIGDFRYEDVFRTQKGQAAHASFYYVSGGRNENRVNTDLWDQPQRMLPVRPGSHPTYAMNVPHNGYTYLFDFKTIGNVWNVGEGIGITPTFWFVPQKGGTAQQVNLYYDASGASNKMIQVGSDVDKKMYSRVYKLADPFRNINTAELQRSAEYEYNFIWTPLERAKTPWVKFYQQYLTRQLQISDQGYNNEVLGYRSRTIIGPQPPTGSNVTQERAERSVQHWYGEYNLPVAPYILPTGTSVLDLAKQYGGALTGKEKEFMKNGYIIVNFKINTLREKNGKITELLGYQGEIANMWEIEGQVESSSDIYGNSFKYQWGDHILFESDYSVRNDYQGAGH